MMKISLSRLEEARLNPEDFVSNLIKKNKLEDKIKYKYSRYMCWQNSALHYHNINNKDASFRYLQEKLSKFKMIEKNPNLIQEYMDKLENYISNFRLHGLQFIEARKLIKLQLSVEFTITSKIPVIAMMKKGGYFIYYFTKNNYAWERELKFPILQSYFSEAEFGCKLSEVNVGVYCYETDEYYHSNYSDKEVGDAVDELDNLSKYITKEISK